MMNLKIQIITIIFSIIFGFLFSLLINILKKWLFKINKILQLFISLLITIVMAFVYFYVLLKLNNAIIHPYFIFAFIFGYYIEILVNKLFKRIVLFIKKWYNFFGG